MSRLEHTTIGTAGLPLQMLVTPADLRARLTADVRAGLTAAPRSLPPKYFYDDTGSRLFEQITRLPEYYPTRTERALLATHAPAIADSSGASTLLELGSGSSEKTRLLLDAMAATGTLEGYVPVDVSPGALAPAMRALRREYPLLRIQGVVADVDHHLDQLPPAGPRLIAFLGSTLGNYQPGERHELLTRLSRSMTPGESLLLGVDLVKDPARLIAAYDDAAGVTARFNRNVLTVLNHELGADFDPRGFDHLARWVPEREWIEMRLRANRAMTIHVTALALRIDLSCGEEIRTEISAKFRQEGVQQELAAAGLRPEGWWTDPAGDFALVLARP